MRYGHFTRCAGLLVAALLLASCGSGNNSGDVFPWAALTITPTSGPDSFLLFPNPQKQADGTLQTNTSAYATAYYAAIDPANAKDTLDKWKAANGFGSGTGTETTVVFGDVKDLGYGRRMTARQNPDGTIAVMVENYLVSAAANYTYSSFNLDAAVVRDQRWHVGTNGIEYSPPPGVPVTANCGNCYAKFSNFNATTGQRQLAANLDGRGDKAMPGICISCHGGRADPLKYDGSFPRSVTSFPGTSDKDALAGDVQAHLQPLDVGSFDFSTTPGYTRADQEAALKTINKLVLCSYPLRTGTTSSLPEDACRRVAGYTNEWQGSAAEMLKSWYGGDNMPNSVFSDTYVPASWQTANSSAAAENLYKTVIAPSCRVCHLLRGTANQADWTGLYDADISFMTYNDAALSKMDFLNYADRIKAHVIDRGNMPLGKIIYERFWDSTQPDTLATFLESQGQSVHSNGVLLTPGRPVADPGPDRTTDSPATLSAANSLYATTYTWSIVSGTGGSLTNANSAQATLNGVTGNTYGVQLVVGNGSVQSAPVTVNVTIDTPGSLALPKAAGAISFADIKAFIQGSPPGCTGCHTPGDPQTTYEPPIFYTNYDRNGDTLINTTDDLWFYNDLRGRINFTDIAASPLLRKPTGHHHGGGTIIDTASTSACTGSCVGYATLGDYYKAQYNMIVLWILNGAPY